MSSEHEEDEGQELPDEFPYDPYSGFRFTVGPKLDANDQVIGESIFCEVHSDAKPVDTHIVCDVFKTEESTSEQKRLLRVLDMLSGYLNTGGDFDLLMRLLADLKPFFNKYKIELPEGWKFLDWIGEQAEEDQYIFRHDRKELIGLVVPECYTEVVPAAAFLKDLEEDSYVRGQDDSVRDRDGNEAEARDRIA